MSRVGAPVRGAPFRVGHDHPVTTGKSGGTRLDVGLIAVFCALTAGLSLLGGPDLAMRDLADAYRPQLAYDVAVNVNRLGSGGWLALIAAVIAIVRAARGRSLRPLAPVVAAFVLVAGIVQPIKLIVHRAPPHLDIVDGLSYPSGHAVNTIVWYGVICLLLAPWLSAAVRASLRWAPPIIVSVTGTYLGFHWLTDMLAGLCLGLLIDRLVTRIDRAVSRIDRPVSRIDRAATRTAGPR